MTIRILSILNDNQTNHENQDKLTGNTMNKYLNLSLLLTLSAFLCIPAKSVADTKNNRTVENKNEYSMQHAKVIQSREAVKYVENYNEEKPLVVFLSRPQFVRENKATDIIANNFSDEINVIFVHVKAWNQQSYDDIKPFGDKFKTKTLPGAFITDGKNLLGRVPLLTLRKNPEAFYRLKINEVLKNL